MDIQWSKTAQKQLMKVDKRYRQNIIDAVKKINDTAYQNNIKAIVGSQYHRLRIGKYRVLFERTKNTIRIERVKTRGDVYK